MKTLHLLCGVSFNCRSIVVLLFFLAFFLSQSNMLDMDSEKGNVRCRVFTP